MASLQSLPRELKVRVLEEVIEWDAYYSSDVREVLLCGLISRTWVEPSHDVALRGRRFGFEEGEPEPMPSIESFGRLIVSKPGRLQHLRALTLDLPDGQVDRQICDCVLTLVGLHATGLVKLELYEVEKVSPIAAAALAQRQLTHLTVTGWHGDGFLRDMLDGETGHALQRLHSDEDAVHPEWSAMLSALHGRALPGLEYWSSFSSATWPRGNANFRIDAPRLSALSLGSAWLEFLGKSSLVNQIKRIAVRPTQSVRQPINADLSAYGAAHTITSCFPTPATLRFFGNLPLSFDTLRVRYSVSAESLRAWLSDDAQWKDNRRSLRCIEAFNKVNESSPEPEGLRELCTRRNVELEWETEGYR